MGTTEWGIIIGAFLTTAAAQVGWGFALMRTLGGLVAKVDGLMAAVAEDQKDKRRIWEHLDKHAERITRLEERTPKRQEG